MCYILSESGTIVGSTLSRIGTILFDTFCLELAHLSVLRSVWNWQFCVCYLLLGIDTILCDTFCFELAILCVLTSALNFHYCLLISVLNWHYCVCNILS